MICFKEEDGIQKQSEALAFSRSSDWGLFLGGGVRPSVNGELLFLLYETSEFHVWCSSVLCFVAVCLGYFGFSLCADF